MKILQVIPYYYPAWEFGGPVKVAHDVSKELVARGHSVTVFTSDVLSKKTRVSETSRNVDGVNVYYFKNLTLHGAKRKLFITPSLFSAVKNSITSFDVVHIHGNRTTQSPILHHFLKKKSVPYVVQAHGGLPLMGTTLIMQLYDLFFGNNLLRDASKVIALSQMEVKQYLSMGVPAENIVVIPNGIDLSEYTVLPPKGFFKEYGVSENEKIVLYLGRLNKIKGIDILVNAFVNIVKTFGNVRLVVVGPDDGYLRELKALISALKMDDKILIAGPLYDNDKVRAYVDADVYVLPSRYEIFSMTVLEAVASRTPLVLTSKCGIADYFKDKVGLVVNPDPTNLSEAILELLSDPKKRDLFRNRCDSVIEMFDIEKTVSKLEEVYETTRLFDN